MPDRTPFNAGKFTAVAVAIIVAVTVAVKQHSAPAPPEPPLTGAASDPTSVEYYHRQVQPIFRENCNRCHAGWLPKGGLRLDSQDGILHGGKHGPILTPGHPESSKIIVAIRHEGSTDATKPMPPKDKLSDADIATITAWVKAGAPMSKNSEE